MAKAACWTETDTKARKRGEQKGLDTLVVHAVNVVHSISGHSTVSESQLTRKCTA